MTEINLFLWPYATYELMHGLQNTIQHWTCQSSDWQVS